MKVILHIGSPKTGTSSIQRFLFKNQKLLQNLGYYYHTYTDEIERDMPIDFYSHYDMLLAYFKNQKLFKNYFKTLFENAEKKGMHTIIISSDILFTLYREKDINELVKLFGSDITTIVYLRRPDIYIESMWQQWFFMQYNSFEEYLKNHRFPNYYEILNDWDLASKKLVITPFEKLYFPDGLERHFLNNIGISKVDEFDCDYIDSDDYWGKNRGLTPEGLELVMMNKDFLRVEGDRMLLHRFISKYFSTLFEKNSSEKYTFLTDIQRKTILRHYDPILKKIISTFSIPVISSNQIFNPPEVNQTYTAKTELNYEHIIQAFFQLSTKQDKMIMSLENRINEIEKNLLIQKKSISEKNIELINYFRSQLNGIKKT